jgi:hypothetical protein
MSLQAYDRSSITMSYQTESFARRLRQARLEKGPDRILLTGDQQLRRRAGAAGVEVHGVLWVTDQLAEHAIMTHIDLADALERLVADPLVFLPEDEVRARITEWGRSS